ncbi:efflux RND transporter periplasmic adaptor subunit [candidate division CSSED10-310 bacterium]|uniref:Efflux RND transporter periplasmic adaptor subunit n=1 Tax=candidate division CSSED10-310 bacterium TaxID=2855610 RepID=A0ABV6YZ80_UNCC1
MDTNNTTSGPDLSKLRLDPAIRENKTSRKAHLITLITVFVIISIISLVIIFKRPSVEVTVAMAKTMDSNQGFAILNASGYVTPRRRATIAAKITGRIVQINVEEGMFVEQKFVLARLDDTDVRALVNTVQAELNVAKASIAELDVNLKDAQRNLRRYQDLYFQDVVSQQNVDEYQRQVDALTAKQDLAQKQVIAAQARLDAALNDLENYIIIAPFSGIVVSKDAQIGEMVSPISAGGGYTRTGIATIVDMESLEIEVDVNESYIAKVKEQQDVTAVLDAYPDWKIPARVRTIIPTADRQKATVKVRITFNKLDPRILPDMGVKVTFLDHKGDLPTGQPLVIIPRDSIRENKGKQIVFIFKNDQIEQRAISVGHIKGNDIEVLAGISAGEMVVTSETEDLKNGQKARLTD